MTTSSEPVAVPAELHCMESLSVVVPAHNEEQNLEPLVADINAACSSLFGGDRERWEVIIVDDGSTDATGSVAHELFEAGLAQVLHHPQNRGYGAALRTGFDAARSRYVAFIDGDRQLDPQDFLLLAPFARRSQLAVGYRARRDDPLHRRMLGKLFSRIFVPLVIGVNVRDVDCALKIIPRELLRIAELSSEGALVNSELLAIAVAEGYSIHQEPVRHYPRVWGTQSGGSLAVIGKVFVELYRVRRRVQEHVSARARAAAVAARSA